MVYKVRIDGREVFFYILSEEELLQLGNLIGAVFYIDLKPRYDEIIMRLKKLVEQLNKMSKEDLKLFKVWLKNIATCGMTEEETGGIEKIIDENKEVDEMVYAMEIAIRNKMEEIKKQGKIKGKIEGKFMHQNQSLTYILYTYTIFPKLVTG